MAKNTNKYGTWWGNWGKDAAIVIGSSGMILYGIFGLGKSDKKAENQLQDTKKNEQTIDEKVIQEKVDEKIANMFSFYMANRKDSLPFTYVGGDQNGYIINGDVNAAGLTGNNNFSINGCGRWGSKYSKDKTSHKSKSYIVHNGDKTIRKGAVIVDDHSRTRKQKDHCDYTKNTGIQDNTTGVSKYANSRKILRGGN